MGYVILIAGLLVWSFGHWLKRLAPGPRGSLGDAGKGLVAALALAGIVLMVLGYRWAPVDPLWTPPSGARSINNLLVLLAFYLFAASGMKTAVTRWVRHPQLWAVRLWAIAHLLVKGDLAALILFGGLFVWAQISVFLINRADPFWSANPEVKPGKEIGAIVGTVLVVGIVGLIHGWIGPSPFG